MNIIFGQQTQFEYINYKGIKSTRNVVPMSLYFGATEFHSKHQWLMVAYDLDKQCERTFALNDIVIVGSLADQISQLSDWKRHNINLTRNCGYIYEVPNMKYDKCLVCDGYHDNGNLPCPYNKLTSTV